MNHQCSCYKFCTELTGNETLLFSLWNEKKETRKNAMVSALWLELCYNAGNVKKQLWCLIRRRIFNLEIRKTQYSKYCPETWRVRWLKSYFHCIINSFFCYILCPILMIIIFICGLHPLIHSDPYLSPLRKYENFPFLPQDSK